MIMYDHAENQTDHMPVALESFKLDAPSASAKNQTRMIPAGSFGLG